ncbi:MAG: transcriptional regulator [Methanophagales archaeon ANME-1-THS]|nr:MAG: transcriptional regulator [Methanophagales archaeon ANME-1-THS]
MEEARNDSVKERRGRLEIMVEVLSIARGGVGKTEIVYKANLNFKRVKRYLAYLEEKGLIENSRLGYKTTDKGEEFLRDYQKMSELLLI